MEEPSPDRERVWSRHGDLVLVATAALLGVAGGELLGRAILPLALALLFGDGEAAWAVTAAMRLYDPTSLTNLYCPA